MLVRVALTVVFRVKVIFHLDRILANDQTILPLLFGVFWPVISRFVLDLARISLIDLIFDCLAVDPVVYGREARAVHVHRLHELLQFLRGFVLGR